MTATSPGVYTFDLSINQSGETITGVMNATNAGDPDDAISGTVTAGGTITFTRTRVSAWTQVYTGTVKSANLMEGTFTHTPGSGGPYPWNATR